MSLRDAQNKVREFHVATGSTVGNGPQFRDQKLRASLVAEEFAEFMAALGYHADIRVGEERICKNPDLSFEDAIDAICDLIYVLLGSAVAWDIDIEPFFREVHRANMAKTGGPMRADGKRLKPEGWQPPDIAGILQDQVWSADEVGYPI